MSTAIRTQHIHIIGLGVTEKAVLSDTARQALMNADVIVGSDRQLLTITDVLADNQKNPNTVVLPKLSELLTLIESHSDKIIAVLASGDPLYYGIGRWFTQHINREQLTFYPAVSSIQSACHLLGLSLQDVDVLSLHGRPLEKIRTQLQAHKKLVLLTDKNSQPQILAKECAAAGFEQSTLTVCENLGYAQQQVRCFSVDELLNNNDLSFDPLHVTVITVAGEGGVLPEFPGIPDTHYITGAEPGKGMISKREVRLVILSLLQPSAQDIIWDIGAGCGGVAIELAYWNESLSVHAIECHTERLEYLQANRQRFGVVQNLHITAGRAPEALTNLPAPNKIFIGGSDGELRTLLADAWRLLPEGGILVASAVIHSSKEQLSLFAERLSSSAEHTALIESVEMAVNRGAIADGKLSYQSKLPVEIFKFTKGPKKVENPS
jgi:precorrin-6Y C5,15-methyltransferase (decarboxylating)